MLGICIYIILQVIFLGLPVVGADDGGNLPVSALCYVKEQGFSRLCVRGFSWAVKCRPRVDTQSQGRQSQLWTAFCYTGGKDRGQFANVMDKAEKNRQSSQFLPVSLSP